MSGCHLCNFTGLVVVCEEPMAGLAGFSSEPCSCAAKPCPRGLCDGSGLLAPHPATLGADAGLDDPCPCRDAVTPPTAASAWAKRDEIAELWRESNRAKRAAIATERDIWIALDAATAAAEAVGPRHGRVDP